MSQEVANIDIELELQVRFSHYPASRGRRERVSGVQLEPDEPATSELEAIYLLSGPHGRQRRLELDMDKLDDHLLARILEQAEDETLEKDGGY